MGTLRELLESRSASQDTSSVDLSHINRLVLKLASHASDFSGLVGDLAAWKEESVEHLLDHLHLRLQANPSLSLHTPEEVLESLIIQTANEYIQAENIDGLQKLGILLVEASKQGILDREELTAEFLAPLTTPQVVLALHKFGFISMGRQLEADWRQAAHTIKAFLSKYVEEVANGGGEELTAALILVAFPSALQIEEEVPELQQKRALLLLNKLLDRVMEKILGGSWGPSVGQLVCASSVPPHYAALWALHALSQMMRYKPTLKISRALKLQEELKRQLPPGLDELCTAFLIAASSQSQKEAADKVVGLILRLLTRAEVNWQVVLCIASLAPRLLQEADSLMATRLKEHIRDGLETADPEAFVGGLVVARQCCLQSTPCFPSYLAWFGANFGSDDSIATSPQSVRFLLEQLTSLVPSEPPFALRAHLARPPFLHRQPRQILEDYKQLARIALLENEEDSELQLSAVLSPADSQQARELLSRWRETGKIPPLLHDASMFRKQYYTSQLLPALMLAGPLTEEEDAAKQALIQVLHSRGRIPHSLYRMFVSGELAKKYRRGSSGTDGPENTQKSDPADLISLDDQLAILCNLPSDFLPEILQSLATVEAIVNKLIPVQSGGQDLTASYDLIVGKKTAGDEQHVFERLLAALVRVTSPEATDGLVKILTSTRELVVCGLSWIIVDFGQGPAGRLSEQLGQLFDQLVQRRPVLRLSSDGIEIPLDRFLFTARHEMLHARGAEQLAALAAQFCRRHPEADVPAGWTHLQVLVNMRRALTASDILPQPFIIPHLDSEAAAFLFPIEMSIQQDNLSPEQKLFLLRQLVAAMACSKEEKMELVLRSLPGHSTTSLTPILALQSVEDSKPEEWARIATTLAQSGSAAGEYLRLLQLLPGARGLEQLAVRSRDDSRVLLPLSTAAIFCSQPSGSLPAIIRISVANYNSLGCLSCSDEVRRGLLLEFPGVYAWNSSTEDFRTPNSPEVAGAALQFGLAVLAQEYLQGWDCFLNSSTDGRVGAHLAKLRTMLQASPHLEQFAAEPPGRWLGSCLSSQLTAAVRLVLMVACSRYLPISSQFCITNLLSHISQIIQENTLSGVEEGILKNQLLSKVKSLDFNATRKSLGNVDPSLVGEDLYQVLRQYFRL